MAPRTRPTHRQVRANRRRAGALAGAFALTLVIGSVALVGQVRGGAADASASASSSLEAVSLAPEAEAVAAVQEARATATLAKTVEKQAETLKKADTTLPQGSGDGRRIVFSESRQRVWLIGDAGKVERTYLASGSKYDNLDPGTYAVQSRTENATAFDYSGTMKWFVRFTQGQNAPIGFHSVPRDNDGNLEQTKGQLGTPLSSGCVRQWPDDAKALWDFAPVGTTVVVTA